MPRALLGLVAIALLSGAHLAGEVAGEARSVWDDRENLMYLPEGHVLKLLSLGHRNLVADFVWLQAIQYYGEQRLTTRNYDQTERIFRVIYELDPSFKGATRFGALVLAQDAGEPAAALALLDQAERDKPGTWEYAFDRGFILQTVVKDYEGAAKAYREAAERPGAPPVAARLAGMSFARLGDRHAAREIWRAVYDEADNEMMRSIAERNLLNLDMADAEDALAGAVHRWSAERESLPKTWGDLVDQGYLRRLPEEPWGGRFVLDPESMEVWATTRLDRTMAQERDVFQELVRQARRRTGEWPASLPELVELGIARFPPFQPLGLGLDYDSRRGVVSWNPPWEPTEPRNHGEGTA